MCKNQSTVPYWHTKNWGFGFLRFWSKTTVSVSVPVAKTVPTLNICNYYFSKMYHISSCWVYTQAAAAVTSSLFSSAKSSSSSLANLTTGWWACSTPPPDQLSWLSASVAILPFSRFSATDTDSPLQWRVLNSHLSFCDYVKRRILSQKYLR